MGLKPTYGMVSRHGLIAYASSFDQIGPISKSAYEIDIVMKTISEEMIMTPPAFLIIKIMKPLALI